jgi:hypothetical protein
MKERPILFSAPMVRAILDGSKTQTRRVVKHQPEYPIIIATDPHTNRYQIGEREPMTEAALLRECPYGQPGDRLWVRETWQYYGWSDEGEPQIRFAADNATTWPKPPAGEELVNQWEILSRPENYNIDNHARDRRWRPSIHMPRWASRILLEIVSVRVERLNAISYEDARAEGIDRMVWPGILTHGFKVLWEQINGAGSWDANPWVWCIEFKRVTP